MTNEFWTTLATLDLITNFKFQENAGLPDSISFDKNTGKASTYKLIRNYVLLEEHQPDSVYDLGWYQANWSLEESPDTILYSIVNVLKGIHKLNYLSYRREYQKQQKKA